MHTPLLRRMLVVFTLILALSAAIPLAGSAKPADNGGPGNSGAAHVCQKGGWETLAPADNPTVAFANQDECVSYGAEGGVVQTVSSPSIAVSFEASTDSRYCWIRVQLVDFAPNTTYPVSVSMFGGAISYSGSLMTDGDGFADGYPIGTYGAGAPVQVFAGGISSDVATISC